MGNISINKSEINYTQILKNIPEFSLLDPEHLNNLASIVKIKEYPPDSIVFRENEMGDAFYIVLTGKVKTFVTNIENSEMVLLHLGPMESFGEMGFITGKPRAASAKTVTGSVLLVITKNDFDSIIEHDPSLTKTFINILGQRLRADNERVIEQSNKKHELKQFWVEKGAQEPITLVGKSKHIQELKDFSLKSADNNIPVFFIGEKGTGKLARAQFVFANSKRNRDRYLIVDCSSIRQVSDEVVEQNTNEMLLGIVQESTLFGHLKGSLPFAKTRRLGYIEVAEGGTIVIDNVEKLTPGVQEKLLSCLKTGYYLRIGSRVQVKLDVKMILTSDSNIKELAETGKFNKGLYDLLMRQSILLVPLRERKRDIHDLVDHFIDEFSKKESKNVLRITKEAMNLLLGYDWPDNIDQLKGVVRRAVSLAEEEELDLSHIFLGPIATEKARGLNLLKLNVVRDFVKGGLFPDVFRNAISIIYISVIFVLLFGFNGYDRKTVLMVWAISWPLLLISAIFTSRLFCGLCPMRTIAEKVQKKVSLNLKIPAFIKRKGPYIGLFGFTVILSTEYIMDMPNSPASTACLFLSILGFAVIFSILFERAVWCRYLCPLGYMTGIFSKLSIFEIRANTSVCNSECRLPTCYNGTEENKGCPMYLGVFNMYTNESCIFCGQCIKNCNHKSVRLNLRLPAAELFRDSGLASYRSGANLAIAFFIPVLIAGVLAMNFAKLSLYSQLSIGLNSVLHYIVFYLFFYVVSLGLIWYAVMAVKDKAVKSTSERFIWYACSFIPIAFAGEIANQIITFINGFGQMVPEVYLQLASYKLVILNHQESTGVVKTLQVFLIILGTIASSFFCKRVTEKVSQGENRYEYRPVFVVNAIFFILFITVFILRA